MQNSNSKHSRALTGNLRQHSQAYSTEFASGAISTGPMANRRKQYLGDNRLDKRKMTELPIYQLLRAFNLQQYTLVSDSSNPMFILTLCCTQKLAEMGYGDDIYKLALLSTNQRNDLVT